MHDLLKTPTRSYWKKVGLRHHHGFVIPLFSLHSKESSGIGEYPDLIPVMKWMKKLGYDIIQLLPLNDTGNNSSPYSALTAFGLNPIHLGLSRLPGAKKLRIKKSARIDYESLFKKREAFLRAWYAKTGIKLVGTKKFAAFKKKHPWLTSFALFKTLKEKHNWSAHEEWDEKPTKELERTFKDEINYHSVIQYYCFEQMHQVKKVAEKLGMHLLGDIPILLGRESADVWANPHLFRSEFNAGVPPDIFAKDGQNWRLPIYNWKQMKKDNYQWWKTRLNVASLFYDIYRIDHILGFYRIWAIPKNLRGRKGFYTPETPKEWLKQGREILTMMINHKKMFPVGEDLGFIPDEINASLRKLGIPGWKVARWERAFAEDGSFTPPSAFPPASITCFSTHDTTSLGQWWIQEPKEAADFAKLLQVPYKAPLSTSDRINILRLCHTSGSLFHINMLQDYLSLIPSFTYENIEDERVNMPSTENTFNWSIRFVPSIEKMTASKAFATYLKEIIAK
jgi:4-alpha-glucanotransferase